jgi:hypothetical protein
MPTLHMVNQIISPCETNRSWSTLAIWLATKEHDVCALCSHFMNTALVSQLVAFGSKALGASTVGDCAAERAGVFVFVFSRGGRLVMRDVSEKKGRRTSRCECQRR